MSLLLLWLATVILHQQMISRLRSRHHVLWLELDSPTTWGQALGRWLPVHPGGLFGDLRTGKQNLNYAGWISIKGYLMVQDDRMAAIGKRLQALTVISGVWGLIVVVAAVARVQRYI
jgi:hypothetical protein